MGSKNMDFVYWIVFIIHIVVIIIFLTTEKRSPSATLAWILLLFFLPAIGFLLYLLVGSKKISRLKRESKLIESLLQEVLQEHQAFVTPSSLTDSLWNSESRILNLLKLSEKVSHLPPSRKNHCQILFGAKATYQAISHAIMLAKKHIHIEFYIIRADETGYGLRELLVQKASQGVDVRVLYDAVGSSKLPKDFWLPLELKGGLTAAFNPIRIFFRHRDRMDFRNHRKIVIVDGKIGLTGGINVGKEYLGLCPQIGHWRDSHIQITGPAVLSLQQVFAEDWFRSKGELLEDKSYYPLPSTSGDSIVHVIASGPDDRWAAIRRIYFQAIALAQKRVWITSPYFIPDPIIEEVLIVAALRGVDVRLLLPLKSDSKIVSIVSHSYYPDLKKSGVRIYEYAKGFIHAKTMVIDDWLGTIGSANMDTRSFQLNFELNAFVYDPKFTEELAEHFLEDIKNAQEISEESLRQRGYWQKFQSSFFRILSPLL